jgi:hypothetical protein
MISEHLFARSFSSFWRDLLPFSEVFVRGVNGRWGGLIEDPPGIDPLDRAIANEGAVRLYRRVVEADTTITGSLVAASIQEAASWMNVDDYTPPEGSADEVEQMARSLEWRYEREDLLFSPAFAGCGVLGACEGDFLKGETLVEVKSGNRGFRSPDFRQVVTYLALNHAARHHTITRVNVYNARLNRLVDLSVADLCMQLAGDGEIEVFSRVIEFAAGAVMSGI